MLAFATLRGASWLIFSRLFGRVVDFINLLILARLLVPADFGVVESLHWLKPVLRIRRLELGDFSDVVPALSRYTMKTRDYRTNKYALPPDVANRVRRRWGPYFQRYGYDVAEATLESA